MTLNDIFFSGKQRILRLKARDVEGTIKEIVTAMVAAGRLSAEIAPLAIKALLDREQVSSTGIGSGVAIPHARIDAIPDIVGLVGISKEGIDFGSIDGQPVKVMLLLLSPKTAQSAHLNTLANLARFVRDEKFKKFLEGGDDAQFEDAV